MYPKNPLQASRSLADRVPHTDILPLTFILTSMVILMPTEVRAKPKREADRLDGHALRTQDHSRRAGKLGWLHQSSCCLQGSLQFNPKTLQLSRGLTRHCEH